jgi:hypothetical protein
VVACILGGATLAAAGCGASSHPNDPRPQVSTRISITIGPHTVIVQPGEIGVGPERTQQIPQNENHPQPPIKTKAPLGVVFVSANQTQTETHLVIQGPKDLSSPPIDPQSPGTFQTSLPTGTYRITAAGIPTRPATLTVGPYRASSQNNLLLP